MLSAVRPLVVSVAMVIRMVMAVIVVMVMVMIMVVIMIVVMRQMDVKFDARNGGAGRPRHVQMILVQSELAEFTLEGFEFNPEIDHGADEHVATDPAEDIKVNGAHRLFCRSRRVPDPALRGD